MGSRFRWQNMRRRLAFWFVAIALVPLLGVATLMYFQRASSIRSEAMGKLMAIRDLKVRSLTMWLEERKGDLWVMQAQLPDLDGPLHAPEPSEQDLATLDIVRQQFEQRVVSRDALRELFLADARTGTIAVATDRSLEGQSVARAPWFALTLERRELQISAIYASRHDRVPVMTLSTPVVCGLHGAKHVVAVLGATVDLQSSLYPLLADRTGMGKTGETLIVDEQATALSDLRWRDRAPLNLTIAARPAVLAGRGESGVVETEDYRGEVVLAAYTHIPATRWGFVAKQDLAELHQPIERMLWEIGTLVIFVTLLVGAAGAVTARSISLPLNRAAEVARRIQEGDAAARCAVEGATEIGALASAINEMADVLLAQAELQRAAASVSETLVGALSVSDFGSEVLRKLMALTESEIGVVYRREERGTTLSPIAAVGANAKLTEPFDANQLEGQLGQATATRQISYISDIPEDSGFRLKTMAGEAIPRDIVTVPLSVKDEVRGIIALASLHGYSPTHREMLDRLWLVETSAFANLLASEKSEVMGEALRANNEELQETNAQLLSQSQELQSQADELRKLATELEAQRAQVEEADRLKSEFLSNMSHELRTPLNSILALSQLMISRGPGKDPDQDREFLSIIERNGRQLLDLINDVLDLSRIEAGHVDVRLEVVRADDIVRSAVDSIRTMAADKGLDVIVSAEDIRPFETDQQKVTQIVLNLLSNAVKFTEAGTIDVRAMEADGQISISVRDTGIGIAPADQERIFEEFRQVDGSTTRRHGGTGLGLAICKKLCRPLGGNLTVQSEVDQGSTFTLTLPLQPPTGLDAPQAGVGAEPTPRTDADPGPSSKRIVLVIDDDPKAREVLRKHLQTGGYDVVVAADGREGLRRAREVEPFAITLDVLMPDFDGWEVLRELKAAPQTAATPVVIVSMTDDRATGMALGAVGYIVKPVAGQQLLAELDRIAATRRVGRILVVDDDPAARTLLVSMLSGRYPFVIQASGGKEALQIAASEQPPDVMILDLIMPDLDGFAVLDRLRSDARTRDLPVIIVTAKDLTAEERGMLADGALRIIAKDGMQRERVLAQVDATLADLGRLPLSPTAGSELLVLLVEDDDIAARQIRGALEGKGYAVTVVASGAEALEQIGRQLPDAIVLDLMMPDMDGFQLLEKLRANARTGRLPVLVLTAKDLSVEERERLERNGVHQFAQKGALSREALGAQVDGLVGLPPKAGTVTTNLAGAGTARDRTKQGDSVLVVEDNPDNLVAVTAVLDELAVTYTTAQNGELAVERARTERPGLILMDVQLPVLSGLDATKKIKSKPELCDIPIVALTAHAMRGDRERMLAAGCDAYLAKPLDAGELERVVRRWLKS